MEQDPEATRNGGQPTPAIPRHATHDMPLYERPDGSRVQVLGGSVLASEGVAKVDGVDLSSGATIRETSSDFYSGLKLVR